MAGHYALTGELKSQSMSKQIRLVSYDEVQVRVVRNGEHELLGVITPWNFVSRTAFDSHVNRMMTSWARIPCESFRLMRGRSDAVLTILLVNPTEPFELLEDYVVPKERGV